MSNKVKVIYISSAGRSGSTILNMLLGQLDGFFATGELMRIYRPKSPCGCGKIFRNECEIWSEVLRQGFGGPEEIAAEMDYMKAACPHEGSHQILDLMFRRKKLLSKKSKYIEQLDTLYSTIQKVTDCNVIVDASKYPQFAVLLQQVPSIDLYVLHLVRDSRAIVYSWWYRSKYEPRPPYQSVMRWNAVNSLIELFFSRKGTNKLLVRYEDAISNPQGVLKEILTFVNEPEQSLDFIDGSEVTYHTTHTISGNPMRREHYNSTTLTLRLDMEWQDKLRNKDKIFAELLTFPLLKRYKYM